MHYYTSNRLQTDAYVEYIDGLQCIIDEYGDTVPIQIVGDFNVHLPGPNEHDTVNWYKRDKFTSHSKLMYDFISGNNFNIADLTFKQDVPFTYFNIARGVYSWIDHMLCTEYDMSSVTLCKTIPPDADNVSDHLPLRPHHETTCSICRHSSSHRPVSSDACYIVEQTCEQC